MLMNEALLKNHRKDEANSRSFKISQSPVVEILPGSSSQGSLLGQEYSRVVGEL